MRRLLTMAGIPARRRRTTRRLPTTARPRSTGSRPKGQSLTIGLNKHPFTKSLLPLIPRFRRLTGINVEYLILPEAEYFTKLVADLSQQRGEFSVIMTGPMRNWQYVPPNWILSLDDFLNNPKLTDPGWFKLDDFYPALIAANRWNGKTGGGVGEGPLYSIPVLEESYILAYRKDIFDQYNIKVPTTIEEMAEAAAAGEEECRHSRHRGPRHAEPWPAWAPASSVASSPTPTASGASSTAS